MKKLVIVTIVLILSSCASVRTPNQNGQAIGKILIELQAALDAIDQEAEGSSIPPLKNATITLSTAKGITTEGDVGFILTAEGSKTLTDSNVMTIILVPNKDKAASLVEGIDGSELAKYVVEAVRAIDGNNVLELESLEVEAGFEVKSSSAGGVDIELGGFSTVAKKGKETTNSNSLKLSFGYPEKS